MTEKFTAMPQTPDEAERWINDNGHPWKLAMPNAYRHYAEPVNLTVEKIEENGEQAVVAYLLRSGITAFPNDATLHLARLLLGLAQRAERAEKRVNELLAANNTLVERERDAKARARRAEIVVEEIIDSGRFPPR